MCRIWNLVLGKLALIELFNKIYISLETILVLLSHVWIGINNITCIRASDITVCKMCNFSNPIQINHNCVSVKNPVQRLCMQSVWDFSNIQILNEMGVLVQRNFWYCLTADPFGGINWSLESAWYPYQIDCSKMLVLLCNLILIN